MGRYTANIFEGRRDGPGHQGVMGSPFEIIEIIRKGIVFERRQTFVQSYRDLHKVLDVVGTRSQVIEQFLLNVGDTLGKAFVHHGCQVGTQANVPIEEWRILEEVVIDVAGGKIVAHGNGKLGRTVVGINVGE